METLISILEVIGVVAFSISGALEAIKAKNDILGVVLLGTITAVGGGIIRDLVLGINPPNTFVNPKFIYISVLFSLASFFIIYYDRKLLGNPRTKIFDLMMTTTDAIGLAVFTVLGMNVAYSLSYSYRGVIYIFVGLITGVGGGILRDLMLNRVPNVLDRNIYASASIVGAIVYFYLKKSAYFLGSINMLIAMGIIFTIRMVAATKNLQLPKVV